MQRKFMNEWMNTSPLNNNSRLPFFLLLFLFAPYSRLHQVNACISFYLLPVCIIQFNRGTEPVAAFFEHTEYFLLLLKFIVRAVAVQLLNVLKKNCLVNLTIQEIMCAVVYVCFAWKHVLCWQPQRLFRWDGPFVFNCILYCLWLH